MKRQPFLRRNADYIYMSADTLPWHMRLLQEVSSEDALYAEVNISLHAYNQQVKVK